MRRAAAAVLLLTACSESPRVGDNLVRAALDKPPSATRRVAPPSSLGGAFGYVDTSGTRLLAFDSLAYPARIMGAACRGAVVRVQHVGRQERRPADTGRQVAGNFDNEAGEVFTVRAGARLEGDATCFLSADSNLLAGAYTLTAELDTRCTRGDSVRVATGSGRDLLHCWSMGRTPIGTRILAVQFVTIDTNALAAIVVARDSALLFHPLEGRYRGPAEDIWRVDDQGVFSPDAFRILFLVEPAGSTILGLEWQGTEGGNTTLLVADSSAVFRVVRRAYRYWVPN